MVAALASQGLDLDALLPEAGLSADWLAETDRRWPSDGISNLWRLASERSGNPALGLAAPPLVPPGHYGIVGYAMMSSPDLKTGIGRLIRYVRVVSDGAVIGLVPDQSGGFWATLGYLDDQSPIPRPRADYGLLVLLTFCRWMLGHSFVPMAAAFRCPRPCDMSHHQGAFGCPLSFDQDFDGFLIAERDLNCKLSTASPELAELHDYHASLVLSRLTVPTVARQVQDAIVKRLQDGSPRRSQIAADLGMGDHTLQRRLSAEGTSFSDIVDRTRCELARDYLRNPHLSLSEITYLLGYTDQSPFQRASTRWFGMSPGEYRCGLSPLYKDRYRATGRTHARRGTQEAMDE